jgi:chromosome segregation ATPase
VHGKPPPAKAPGAEGDADDAQQARDDLNSKLKQATNEAAALEKIVKGMLAPPKSLLDALKELQAKADGLRQAKQAAKDPGQVEQELQKKLDQKRKQATASKVRLEKARADLAYFEAQAQKAAKAIAVEEALRTRFRGEIKELFSLLGEPSDSDSDDGGEEETPQCPNTAALAGKEHLRGSAMDLDDPHQVGLAALLAGHAMGSKEGGWSAAAPLKEEKPRSRSPKGTRVADAAAAIESKLAA